MSYKTHYLLNGSKKFHQFGFCLLLRKNKKTSLNINSDNSHAKEWLFLSLFY